LPNIGCDPPGCATYCVISRTPGFGGKIASERRRLDDSDFPPALFDDCV